MRLSSIPIDICHRLLCMFNYLLLYRISSFHLFPYMQMSMTRSLDRFLFFLHFVILPLFPPHLNFTFIFICFLFLPCRPTLSLFTLSLSAIFFFHLSSWSRLHSWEFQSNFLATRDEYKVVNYLSIVYSPDYL